MPKMAESEENMAAVALSTLGVIFDKPGTEGRTGSAGWYNTAAFEEFAHADGLYAKTINGDAFSKEIKEKMMTRPGRAPEAKIKVLMVMMKTQMSTARMTQTETKKPMTKMKELIAQSQHTPRHRT